MRWRGFVAVDQFQDRDSEVRHVESDSNVKIEGTLIFNHSINCAAEVLDMEYSIRVAGHEGTLAMPKLPENFRNSKSALWSLKPPSGADERIPFWTGEHPVDPWGRFYTLPSGESTVLAARIWFHLQDGRANIEAEVRRMSEHVQRHLPKWVANLEQAVEIISCQKLGGGWVRYEENIKVAFGAVTPHGLVEIPALPKVQGVQRIDATPAISLLEFKEALRVASEGREPTLEQLILREARIAFYSGDYRRAIYDAGTAAELGLTKVAHNELKKNPSPKIRKKLSIAGLGTKYRICSDLGISLPSNNFKKKLISPRNDVAHRGTSPSNEEAKSALQAATSLIDQICPAKFEAPSIKVHYSYSS